MKVKDWCKRMEKLLDYKDYDFMAQKEFVTRRCEYKDKYFCNGEYIHSNSENENKPPCKHFKNGSCKLLLHRKQTRKDVIYDSRKI